MPRRDLPKLDYATPAPPVFRQSRGALLLVSLATLAFLTLFYAGRSWPIALERLFTDGALLLLWLTASAGIGAWLLPVFNARARPGAFVTATALGLGILSLLILALGLAGALNRVTAWILLIAGLAAGLTYLAGDKRLSPATLSASLREPIDWTSWLWLIAMPFLAIALVGALMPPGVLWGDEPNGYDVVEYHLQVPREWFEAARIIPLRHNVFSYMPFNVETHYLFAMHLRGGPWAGMYLAQLMHVAMIALTVAALATHLGRAAIAAPLFAIATPWLTLLAPVAYNEGGVLLFGTLALISTLRAMTARSTNDHLAASLASRVQVHDAPTDVNRQLALAGLFTGFACGTKLTAVPMLLLGIPVAYVIAALATKQKLNIRPFATFLLAALLTFSPWLLRNIIWAKNPVFPEAMSILGRAHFTPEQVERWRLAYVPPPAERSVTARLAAAWWQIFADHRYAYLLFPAGILAIGYAFVSRKRSPTPAFITTLLLFWLLFWLTLTHLQSRFFVLAIPAIALLIAQVDRPRWRLGFIAAALVQAAIAFIVLQSPVANRITRYDAAIGLDTLRPMMQDNVAKAAAESAHLCLVGDAKAFLYEVPMSRLTYRTVFDVDARGRDPIDAWSDGCPRAAGDAIIIDYPELRRFARTYHAIPPPSTDADGTAIIRITD